MTKSDEQKRGPGRPRVRPQEGNRRNTTVQIDAALYDKIKHQAENTGLSISREIEQRLEKSFSTNEIISVMVGGDRSADLLSMISSVVSLTKRNGQSWNENPVACHIVAKAVSEIIIAGFPDNRAAYESMKIKHVAGYERSIDDLARNIACAVACIRLAASREEYKENYSESIVEEAINDAQHEQIAPEDHDKKQLRSIMIHWGYNHDETEMDRKKKYDDFVEDFEKLTGRKLKKI